MSKNALQILFRAVRNATGYGGPFYKWEPGMMDTPTNPNAPFKPGYVGRTQIEAPPGKSFQHLTNTNSLSTTVVWCLMAQITLRYTARSRGI